MPHPFQIFQFRDRVVILYEYLHTTREIFTDGSRHPDIPVEFWMGDSRGRWEGNTLVVDVTLFTAETWFDRAGNFHSDGLHVVERYTRTGRDHLQYEATIEDAEGLHTTLEDPHARVSSPGTERPVARIRVLRVRAGRTRCGREVTSRDSPRGSSPLRC